MKFSDSMRFPHPVLAPDTGDYSSGDFLIDFLVEEVFKTGQVALAYEISVTHPDIAQLVIDGRARVGVFVRCQDTYFSSLRELGWPSGKIDFPGGKLLNRVSVRPLIWLVASAVPWSPSGVHPEFDLPVFLKPADIVAIGEETILHIGKAKLAPLESIFALQRSDDVPDGQIRVDLDPDKITIILHSNTFDAVNELRSSPKGRIVVLNAIYLPVLMEVLDTLRGGIEAHDHKRWAQPFLARCLSKGVELGGAELLADAQALLEMPASTLRTLAAEYAP